jgi:peptidylprolyl isomerase
MKYAALILVFAVAVIFTGCGSAVDKTQKQEIPYVTTPSGLKYLDIVVGTGTEAKFNKKVKTLHTGKLEDGTVFETKIDIASPFIFTIGAGMVIKGYDEGIIGMRVGGKRQIIIPSDLAFGSRSAAGGKIPPNSTIIFEVELLGVE